MGLLPKIHGMDKSIVILFGVFWVLGGFFALSFGGFLDPRTCVGFMAAPFRIEFSWVMQQFGQLPTIWPFL